MRMGRYRCGWNPRLQGKAEAEIQMHVPVPVGIPSQAAPAGLADGDGNVEQKTRKLPGPASSKHVGVEREGP
eukprot:CAMPEP_0174367678 /NCGR_PEP_ID=MMETSP0811_2-20130205/86290_1 /TAXON_ID=73025 ORGANISM="Eutreptiella gymnastica-like, Strain CCMP1594" /NCGR_SAMPLE_ID=MMETSP0811_2 /ASSEMBLY_ACC=CAM_ASM_000667 /LENGTH=71 /DNA_ID=CAMNT_0015510493 /DNA_START=734 /DNA_END=949 /DNA_ORIENTATION=+